MWTNKLRWGTRGWKWIHVLLIQIRHKRQALPNRILTIPIPYAILCPATKQKLILHFSFPFLRDNYNETLVDKISPFCPFHVSFFVSSKNIIHKYHELTSKKPSLYNSFVGRWRFIPTKKKMAVHEE